MSEELTFTDTDHDSNLQPLGYKTRIMTTAPPCQKMLCYCYCEGDSLLFCYNSLHFMNGRIVAFCVSHISLTPISNLFQASADSQDERRDMKKM